MLHMKSARARRFTRRLTRVIVPALVAAVPGCRDDPTSPTAPSTGTAADIAPALALSFRQVSAGHEHTCGVATDNRAYCWGENSAGELGDGTTTICSRPVPVAGAT
jgi:hypothetical protein